MDYNQSIDKIMETDIEFGTFLKQIIEGQLIKNEEIDQEITLQQQQLEQNIRLKTECQEVIKADKNVVIALEYLVKVLEEASGKNALFLVLCAYSNLEGPDAKLIANEIKTRLKIRREAQQKLQKLLDESKNEF